MKGSSTVKLLQLAGSAMTTNYSTKRSLMRHYQSLYVKFEKLSLSVVLKANSCLAALVVRPLLRSPRIEGQMFSNHDRVDQLAHHWVEIRDNRTEEPNVFSEVHRSWRFSIFHWFLTGR